MKLEDYAVEGGTTYTVELIPEVVHLDKPIQWMRSVLDAQTKATGENTFQVPGSGARTFHTLLVGDDAWGALAEDWSVSCDREYTHQDVIAELAYRQADAMIKERNR